MFYNGEFCGAQDFTENGQVGQLHLIRDGPVILHHGAQAPVRIDEPAHTPPGEYLTQWRIGLAQSLLRKGKSVKTVSLEVGYGSQPAFSRAFAERTGISPTAWLNKVKGVARVSPLDD